jgi:hypothetical protein
MEDDWLNPPFGVARAATDVGDFRFAYVGPVGTFTPLHRDVYASYSWSANVVGRKMWWLFPPDRLERVKRDGEFAFDVREIEEEGGGIKVVQQVRCSLGALMEGRGGRVRAVRMVSPGRQPGLCE